MSSNLIRYLRIIIGALLVLLFLQYELGIATAMANPPTLPPFSYSPEAFNSALTQVGPVALWHAGLGSLLVALSVANLILALSSKARSVQVFGVLSLITLAIAAGGGYFFVVSGYQNDNASHAMATNFLLSYTFLLFELHFVRPAPQ